MAECECPIGGCEYTGPLRSVEAHISGSTAGEHRGETGRSFREQLREEIESRLNGGGESSEESAPSPSDGEESGPVEADSLGDSTAVDGEGVATSAAALPLAAGAGILGSSDGSGPNLAVVLVAVLVIVMVYLAFVAPSEGADGGGAEEDQAEEQGSGGIVDTGGVVDG